jgi:dipeptidyl aminopeptidase/acylaminoacyl peptidase
LAYQWTQALPNGFLLNVRYDEQIGRYRGWATNLQNRSDQRALVEADSRVSFVPLAPGQTKGHLLYVRTGTLTAHPFDAAALRLTGEPVALAERVVSFSPTGAAAFSASDNGLLVYRTAQPSSRPKWFDRTGREVSAIGKPATFMTPYRLSPDGTKLAATVYDVEKGGMSIWIYDTADGSVRQLTRGGVTEAMPVWSPDGSRVAFGRAAGSTPKLYWRSISGEDRGEPLTVAPFQLPTDWSRDGRFILYQTTGGAGEPGADVVAVDLRNGRKLVPLLHTEAQELEAVFSPDGSSIALVSDETGRPELYLQGFEANPEPRVTGQKRQLSKDGASVVRWRRDGKELYYISADSWLTAVTFSQGHPGPASRLFHLDFPPRQLTSAGPALGYDASFDGQRFLIPDTGASRSTPFVVIENWPELLQRPRK